MILTLAAALLFQEDWSSWRSSRPATDAEKTAAEARLKEWLSKRGVPELEAIAAGVTIVVVEERPVWRIGVETATEARSLVKVTVPLKAGGDPGPRTVHKVDPADVDRPFYDGWIDKTWTVPVEGTADVLECAACNGEGEKACGTCRGSTKVSCGTCSASGRIRCGSCSGGKTNCSTCGGSGRTGTMKSRRSCYSCGGSGRKNCSSCTGSGTRSCGTCSGSRTLTCRDCGASGKRDCTTCAANGRLVSSVSVRITVSIARAPLTYTALPDEWGLVVEGTPEIVGSIALEERAAVIPDEALRNAIVAHASRQRAGEKVLRQRVLITRMPTTFVRYEVGGRRYDAVVLPGSVVARVSPVSEWANRLAVSAGELVDTNPDAAANDAAAALRVDPECRAARAVIERVETMRLEAREREEEQRRLREVKEAQRYHEERHDAEMMQLILVAGAIGLGLFTFVGVLVWRALCRRRWDGGVITR